jgi:hypothetical protein
MKKMEILREVKRIEGLGWGEIKKTRKKERNTTLK